MRQLKGRCKGFCGVAFLDFFPQSIQLMGIRLLGFGLLWWACSAPCSGQQGLLYPDADPWSCLPGACWNASLQVPEPALMTKFDLSQISSSVDFKGCNTYASNYKICPELIYDSQQRTFSACHIMLIATVFVQTMFTSRVWLSDSLASPALMSINYEDLPAVAASLEPS